MDESKMNNHKLSAIEEKQRELNDHKFQYN